MSCPSKRQRMDTPSRLNNLSVPDSSDAADNTTQRRKATSTHSVVAMSAANNERFCVECGATHTPQWREGPQGVHAHTCTCWQRHTVCELDSFRPCDMVQKQHVTNPGSQAHSHPCKSTPSHTRMPAWLQDPKRCATHAACATTALCSVPPSGGGPCPPAHRHHAGEGGAAALGQQLLRRWSLQRLWQGPLAPHGR